MGWRDPGRGRFFWGVFGFNKEEPDRFRTQSND